MNNHRGKASTPVNLRALELIRDAFKGSSLTQEGLAEKCGMPRSTLANFLSETADPRLVHVEWFTRIAVALGVDAGAWMDELEKVVRGQDEPAARRGRRKPIASQTQASPAPTADSMFFHIAGKMSRGYRCTNPMRMLVSRV